ncbi:MAG: L,D-transpeptidase family protein [Akkermansiaceae bacterium]
MKALISLPLAVFLVSCGQNDISPADPGAGYLAGFRTPNSALQHNAPAHARGYWDGDGVEGPASIIIKRSEQKAYFYKGSELVGVSPISTGKSTHTTPAGTFKITQKNKDHKSSLYGVIRDTTTGQIINDDADIRKDHAGPGQVFENAPMPYFMRFNGGIGMHVGHLPGYAASHGCIRMPEPMAKKFFENASMGTPVIVK